jgi:cytochrome P450
MSLDEICTNSVILITAGSETTATLMSGLLFLLLRDPPKLDRPTHEIRSAFKDESEMTFAAEAQLTYLQACIDEALRIYPPVPMSLPRITPPEGGVMSGHFVPGNVSTSSPRME